MNRIDDGWTGGQYSLVRIASAAVLLAWTTARGTPGLGGATALAVIALLVCYGIGWYDRVAAAILIALGVVLLIRVPVAPLAVAVVPTLAAQCLHIATPGAPYGSAVAWGRLDPAGDWRMPPRLILASWIALGAAHAWLGIARIVVFDGSILLGGTQIMIGLVLPWSRRRPWLWLVALAAVPFVVPDGSPFAAAGLTMLHLRTATPSWLPRAGHGVDRVYFDGTCGLCHRVVRFVLAEDPGGRTFRLAPLQGPTFEDAVPAGRREALPDSVVVESADGLLLCRSDAVLWIGRRLGGAWRLLVAPASLLPRALRDAVYDGVARVRHRLYPRPGTPCPVVPASLRDRFDP